MSSRVLFLDITSKCNLRCKHCYNGRYFETVEDSFDKEEFVKRVDEWDIKRIHILGGEPLISENLFFVLDYARIKNIVVSINTNGFF